MLSSAAARRTCAGLLALAYLVVPVGGCGRSSTAMSPGSANTDTNSNTNLNTKNNAFSTGPSVSRTGPSVSRTGPTTTRTGPPTTPTAPPTTRTGQATTSTEDPYGVPVITRVQRRQLAAFALLRLPPQGLPRATRRILRRPIFGIDWKLAQRIPVQARGDYWLVPGNGHLCVISQGVMGSPGVNTTCADTAQALAHGIADVSIALPGVAHRQRLIVGVAPDGTGEVLVRTGGVTAAARLYGDVFVLRDSTLAPPDSISLLSS